MTLLIQDGRLMGSTVGELLRPDAPGIALSIPGHPPTTHGGLAKASREIAAGLSALGVQPGDRVGILAGTRPEWVMTDFGALLAGAVVVPVYHTNSPEECAHVLGHSETRVLFVENAEQAATITSVRTELPALEHVIAFEGSVDEALSLTELRELGAPHEFETPALCPQDPATIVYTSGTTGPPKGCVLSHTNLLTVVQAATERLGMWSEPPVIFLYLPLAHVLARLTALAAVATGGTLVFWTGDREHLVEELAAAAPSYVPTVPRLLEKVHTRALNTSGALGRTVLRRAVDVGARVQHARGAGLPIGAVDRLRHAVADRLALRKVRAVFGPRAPVVLVGAAPIGSEVLEFFGACGLTVLEGYGLTETSSASTLNTCEELRIGSVGRPLPGTEVAIAPDGEVLLRGPHVFAGYHRDPEASEAVLADGWMHTGDLGALDADGYLNITGRKKDLIITSSGKNISPELIESALRETPWISQAVVVGDRRPYLVALVTLDPDRLPELAARFGLDADPVPAADVRLHELIGHDIEAVNARFARIEQIKRFAILPHDLSQAEGELTPTLKVKRAVVQERYADTIERLYSSGSAAWAAGFSG